MTFPSVESVPSQSIKTITRQDLSCASNGQINNGDEGSALKRSVAAVSIENGRFDCALL
jgi:hypothetical protein